MLVLSRKRNEAIVVTVPPSDKEQVINITVVEIRGDKVRIGVDAAKLISVHRDEVQRAIEREQNHN